MSYDKRLLQPNRKIILLDGDGVLIDWEGGYTKYAQKFSSTRYPSYDAVTARSRGDYSHQKWLDRFGSDFWNELDWLPWGKDLLSYCKSLAPTLICTACTDHPSSAYGKIQWLNREVGDRNYIITGAKHALANHNTILVDDREKFIERYVSAGGPAILFNPDNLIDIKRRLREFTLGV